MGYYLPGPAGVASPGVAPDGLKGQFLRKASDLDFDTEWADVTLSSGGGSGSVTSVGLSLPALFSVSGSPVTTSGTLTASLATQAANLVWAGPTSGSAAAPTFRALVQADLPVSPGAALYLASQLV